MWRDRLARVWRFGFRRQEPRLQIAWMTHTDQGILEGLAGADEPLAPAVLAEQLDRNRAYVADRCRRLATRDLVEAAGGDGGDSAYRLTARGARFLEAGLDPSMLED